MQKTGKKNKKQKTIIMLIFTMPVIRIIFRFVSVALVLGKTMKYLILDS